MSIKVMTQAWAATVGDHTDKLVLLALADNANDEGHCYPSLTTVAKRCEISRRTMSRCIQSLVEAGHVSRKDRSGRASEYVIHPTLDNLTPLTDCLPSSVCLDTLDNGASPPSLINPPPSGNRQGNRKRAAKREISNPETIPDEPPPSNLNVEAWHRWVQYRKQIRKPIQPASTLAAQRKLAAFGPDQAAVVEQSIANGWQGIFALKPDAKPKSKLGQQLAEKYPGYEF